MMELVEKLKSEGVIMDSFTHGDYIATKEAPYRLYIAASGVGWASHDVINYAAEAQHFKTTDEMVRVFMSLGIIKDDINKPEHYTLPRAASDCFSVQQQLGLLTDHPVAAAFKYIWRCKQKGTELKDLKKAQWFITKAIELYEAEHKTEKGDKNPGTGTNNKQ